MITGTFGDVIHKFVVIGLFIIYDPVSYYFKLEVSSFFFLQQWEEWLEAI